MKICKSCGVQVPMESGFCPNCGTSLNAENTMYVNGSQYGQTNTNKTNGLCIAGFICSFLSPIIGLILSIVGLTQSKSKNEGGSGLAIAGIVISVVNFIIAFIILMVFSANYYYYF